MKTINDYTKEIHNLAIEKGWWKKERDFGEIISNIHAELSEAWEEYRNKKGVKTVYFEKDKPCGVGIELADAIIRILDFCGRHKINIEYCIQIKHKYNKTRPYRHGNKKA